MSSIGIEAGLRSGETTSFSGITSRIGSAAYSAILSFEAWATRITTTPDQLQLAADRENIPPEIRDLLLAQGAIRSYFEVNR